MKKLLASLVVFSFLLVGCGGSSSEEFEVALVTDAGDINDKSFNQSAWEAVEQYQKDHDATLSNTSLYAAALKSPKRSKSSGKPT